MVARIDVPTAHSIEFVSQFLKALPVANCCFVFAVFWFWKAKYAFHCGPDLDEATNHSKPTYCVEPQALPIDCVEQFSRDCNMPFRVDNDLTPWKPTDFNMASIL